MIYFLFLAKTTSSTDDGIPALPSIPTSYYMYLLELDCGFLLEIMIGALPAYM